MRDRVLDMPLALTILWFWIGIVAVSIACWWLVKWWKNRHPPPTLEPALPCAQRLQRRYRDRRLHGCSGTDGAVDQLPKKR